MPLDIRDESAGGNITLTLYVDGAPWARAHVGGDVFAQMHPQLGSEPGDLVAELRAALERLHAYTLEKVELGAVQEERPGSRRFLAQNAFRDHREVTAGVVHYDLGTGVTAPPSAPALGRDKLRYAVHEELVKGNPSAEQLRRALG